MILAKNQSGCGLRSRSFVVIAMSRSFGRVISIQSHVVSGYVGNKSATFPLQVLGFEVDPINSVQFSNHKGYPTCLGQILDSKQLAELYQGLKINNLHHYTHILTGYIGSESFLKQVADVVRDLKTSNPNIVYVCDPVMGDNGKMYVPPELLPIYKEKIIPLADVITPNQYEAELLTGQSIHNEETALQAMQTLHGIGAKTVVISSSNLGNEEVLVALGSIMTNGSKPVGIKLKIPRLPATFIGTGDLFAALLLAWLYNHPDDLKLACEKTVSTLQHVLKRTLKWSEEDSDKKDPQRSWRELRIIQSKKEIEEPEICVRAELL